MEVFALARVIYVLAVIIWIGGVAMVTVVIIPAVKRMKGKDEQVVTFEIIEGHFANFAKGATLLTAASGFYMLEALDAWGRYFDLKYWWIHAMTLIWVLFTLVLFVLEPLVLHKLFRKKALANPGKTFKIMGIAHWVLLIMSLITTAGAVAGSHGWFWL